MPNSLFSKKFTFLNILPYSPGREKEIARRAVDYMQRTGNETVLYSLTLHPEGFPAMKKAETLLNSFRLLKKELAGTPVKLGVLLQSILGHYPRVDKNEEAWVRSVNVLGKPVRYCTLDENYRKYIFDVIAMIAKEKPAFILGDDDIRGFSPYAECFCELHTALFNRLTGKNYTPGEYRETIRTSSPASMEFQTFEKLRRDIFRNTAALIREAVDSVDPDIPAGVCLPGTEPRTYHGTAEAIAAKGQTPVLRVCNANYQEMSSREFPTVLIRTMQLKEAYPENFYLLDEADAYPRNLFSRSSKGMHAKLCSSILTGLRGAKVWFVNAEKLGYPIHRNYTEILEKYQHFYQKFAAEAEGGTLTGVAIPGKLDFSGWHSAITETLAGFQEEPNYGEKTFGLLGIPCQGVLSLDKDEIYAVAGAKNISCFSDADLKKMLSGKLLLDGPAAAAVCARGFSKELGLTAEMIDFRFTHEKNPETGQFYEITKAPGVPKFTLLDDKAEVLTKLYYLPFNGSPDLEEVAPATVFYRNELGGTVCCTAFHQQIDFFHINELRKKWYMEILDRLNGKKLPLVCLAEQDITVLTRKSSDGSMLVLACNLNFDDLTELSFRCDPMPQTIQQLMPDGQWKICDFRQDADTVSLPVQLSCYDLVVLKFQ